MADIKSEVEAHIASMKRFGAAGVVRVKLTTEEAIALAKSIEPKELQNAAHVTAHAKAFEQLAAQDVTAELAKSEAAAHALLAAKADAAHKFWEAFHGQPFAGAEIVRRAA